jgi:enterochelin esterase-like enzyme
MMQGGDAAAGSRIVVDTIDSVALRDNPLSDPARRALHVYLPPGYDADPTRRYPAAYLLGALFNSGELLLAARPFAEGLQARLDRLIREQRVPPLIVAMPDARSRYGTGQYLDSPAVGRYASLIIEVVAHMDGAYRTIAHRDARAVLGKSSGGFGALRFGMTRPDLFGLVADHSGDKGFEYCYRCQVGAFLDRHPDAASIAHALADLNRTYAESTNILDFVQRFNLAAMAACYSPDSDAALGFQLPMELGTGRWRPDVWSRWLAHDPVQTALEHAQALDSLKLLYLDCGNRDEHHLHYGSRQLSAILTEAGIAHRYQEFAGGHRETEHRYDISLSAIGECILH